MDFSTIGSVSSYMKSIELETKFKKKKAEGDLGPQSRKMTELEIKNEQFKAEYKRMQEEGDEDKTLATINSKIASDEKLTPEEMRYLKDKNPTLYQKIKNIEDEKKQYEKDLKNCKTKDEVERLKMNKVNSALSTIRSAENDPNLPESAKLAVAQGELRRMNGLNKISFKFVESGEYEKLPKDEEVLEVEKKLKEAETDEEEKIISASENDKFKDVEITDDMNDADNTDTTVKTETADNMKQVSSNAEKSGTVRDKSESIRKSEPTKTEIELSPEAQKIKRSKVKKAYDEVKNNYYPVSENIFREK
ncbi:MAG: hypothetical protein IKH71_14325 [Oscillospiraceae bacterium]|nr:hypothetical protein [Oscillospiraceae bacterium]